MKTRLFPTAPLVLTSLALLFASTLPLRAGDAYKWSVQYLVDHSRSVFGRPQKVSPRRNRGLTLSADGKWLYAGYLHSFDNSGEVRRIAVDTADFEQAVVAILPGVVPKALATDDKGRVYISSEGEILIYDASLKQRQFTVGVNLADGVATAREGGDLALYATDRYTGTVHRWLLAEQNDAVTNATPAGLGGEGVFKVPGALDLRGIEIDAKGRIWMADLKGHKVFRMDRDGKDVVSVEVKTPMDVGCDGARCFVTRSTGKAITVLDEGMNVLGGLNVPWEELELSPFGNDQKGALSGIAVIAGRGFFVSNETGQTTNQKSTYGRQDEHSGVFGGRLFKDVVADDNDPILRATEVTAAP